MFLKSFANGFSHGFGFGMYSTNPFLFGGFGFGFGFGNPFMCGRMGSCFYPSVFSGGFYPYMQNITPPPMIFPSSLPFLKPEFKFDYNTPCFDYSNLKLSDNLIVKPPFTESAPAETKNVDKKEQPVIEDPKKEEESKKEEEPKKENDKRTEVKTKTQEKTNKPAAETKTRTVETKPAAAEAETFVSEKKTEEKTEEKKEEKKNFSHVAASIGNMFKKIFHTKKKTENNEKPEQTKVSTEEKTAAEEVKQAEKAEQAEKTKNKKQKTKEQAKELKMTSASDLAGYDKYDNLIIKYAEEYNIDPLLLKSLIKQESKFNPNAKSYAGAQGLTQLMPKTAKAMGVKNPYDANQSIEGGAKYLKWCLKHTKTTEEALVAYNAGIGNLQKAKNAGKRIDSITDHGCYAKSVLGYYQEYKNLNLTA